MSKNLEHYNKKRQEIISVSDSKYDLMTKTISSFKELHISEDIREETNLSFDYNENHRDYNAVLEITALKIDYRTKVNDIIISFKIDENKKNVIRININERYSNSDSNYSTFIENIKCIIAKKEVVFKILQDFVIYMSIDGKLHKKQKKYEKLIFIKRKEDIYIKFNKIFNKEKNININSYIEKYYKNEMTLQNKSHKEIFFLKKEFLQKSILFKLVSIKIINYMQPNELYVLDKKIISKEKLISILSDCLIYKGNVIKDINDIPFHINNGYKNDEYSYPILSKFLNEALIEKNIKHF
jgi:hypothetical protein